MARSNAERQAIWRNRQKARLEAVKSFYWIESRAVKLGISDWYPLTACLSQEAAEKEAQEMLNEYKRPYRVTDGNGKVLSTFEHKE